MECHHGSPYLVLQHIAALPRESHTIRDQRLTPPAVIPIIDPPRQSSGLIESINEMFLDDVTLTLMYSVRVGIPIARFNQIIFPAP